MRRGRRAWTGLFPRAARRPMNIALRDAPTISRPVDSSLEDVAATPSPEPDRRPHSDYPATLPDKGTWYLATDLPRPGSPRAAESPYPPVGPEEIVRNYGIRNWIEQSYKQVKDELSRQRLPSPPTSGRPRGTGAGMPTAGPVLAAGRASWGAQSLDEAGIRQQLPEQSASVVADAGLPRQDHDLPRKGGRRGMGPIRPYGYTRSPTTGSTRNWRQRSAPRRTCLMVSRPPGGTVVRGAAVNWTSPWSNRACGRRVRGGTPPGRGPSRDANR